MEAYVDDLVRETRLTLDENQREQDFLATGEDNMELDEIIRAKLVEAVRMATGWAPMQWLDPVPMRLPKAAWYASTDGSGYVLLPDDFLRLAAFKLVSWNRAATAAFDGDSEEARMQDCLYTRGTPLKPVCVLDHDLAGSRILRYYTAGRDAASPSGQPDHRLDYALYVPQPAIKRVGGLEAIELPPLLRFAVVNCCAALTETSRGDSAAAEPFFKLAQASLVPLQNNPTNTPGQ